jgi:proteasome lid subunit RPN8/RPN11
VTGDEMVFQEIVYREPVRLCRPDRDRRYACLSYQVPAPVDLPIFLDHRAADAIERHALSDTSVELGGILLGKECLDEITGTPFVWITQSLEAKHYANTQASFTYTHDSWEEITRERDRQFPDLDIVGWYHTHPSFGIFLSHHDMFIHQHFFAQRLQVAYVVDPIQLSRGFFQWRDQAMAQVEGFYLTAQRDDRIALAKVANDLENLPSPQGHAGGALSPRLEAELIKMLTKPSSPHGTGLPSERIQTAMVFGMLGSFLSVLALAGAFWLYQLHSRLQEQGDALKVLARSVDQVSGSQRLAVDALLGKLGTESASQFLERYEQAAKARDDARRQLAAQQSINEALGLRTKELEEQAGKLAANLETARATLSQYETDARLAPKLRERISELETAQVKLQREVDEKNRIVEAAEGQKGAEVLRRLNLFQYTTYILGVVSALLAAALGYYLTRPLLETGSDQPQPEPQSRPHHISD